MHFFEGIQFFILLFVALFVGFLLKINGKDLKNYIFFLSVVFVALIYGQNINSLIYLIIFLIVQYIVILLANNYKDNKKLLKYFIVLALLPLALSKIVAFTNYGMLAFLGISYMTFKVLQIVIETFDNVIKDRVGLYDYLQFMIFFPTISSGPIDRSRRFTENITEEMAKEQYYDLVGTGIFRLLLGIFYKVVLSTFLYQVVIAVSKNYGWGLYSLGYMYSYTAYLFFDFAGYSLMAVGSSNILGIKTPMNFNKPFISTDIKDFWNRWHITLSTWLRDFVFSRIFMYNVKNKVFKKRLTNAMVAYIINMFLMGVWHGLTVSYIAYGLYHGLLMAGFEYYQKKSKFYKKNKNETWYKVLSWFVTMNLIVIGLFIFSGELLFVINQILKK